MNELEERHRMELLQVQAQIGNLMRRETELKVIVATFEACRPKPEENADA